MTLKKRKLMNDLSTVSESIDLTNEIIDTKELLLSKEMMLRLLELNKKLKPLK